MMKQQLDYSAAPINKIDIKFDVEQLRLFLEGCDLFGEYDYRSRGDSPHSEMVDIWAILMAHLWTPKRATFTHLEMTFHIG